MLTPQIRAQAVKSTPVYPGLPADGNRRNPHPWCLAWPVLTSPQMKPYPAECHQTMMTSKETGGKRCPTWGRFPTRSPKASWPKL